MSEKSEKPGVFVRAATGLVRPLSGFDAFQIGYQAIDAPLCIVFVLFLSTVWPGANIPLIVGIAFPFVLGMQLLYALLTVSMPRSGGEYVWVSRLLHPTLGFITNWTMAFLAVVWTAWLIIFNIPQLYMQPWLTSLSEVTGNAAYSGFASFFSQPMVLVYSLIFLVILTVIFTLGMKLSMTLCKITFFISLLGIIVTVGLALATPLDSIKANFLAASGGVTYDQVIETAKNLGFQGGWTWSPTLFAIPWGIQIYGSFQNAAYAAGEIRRPEKSVWVGMIGMLVFYTLVVLGGSLLLYQALGFDFVNALVYLSTSHPEAYPLAGAPSLLYLMSLFTRNFGVLLFLGISWLSILFTHPFTQGFTVFSRSMLAWSFDRVLPDRVADVNRRFHTPHWTIIVTGILTFLLIVLGLYTGILYWIINFTLVMMIAFIIVAIAALVFPYRSKRLFEASPAAVKARLGPIRLLHIAAILTIIGNLWGIYGILYLPQFGTPITYDTLGIAIGFCILLPVVIYYVARYFRGRQGIQIDLAYKEVPPE